MAKVKCSEGCGRDAEFYCVETKKVYHPRCMSRVHNFELPKTLTYTFEKIDYEHKGTHEITTYILNTLVTVVIALAFMSRGWTDNYFKGEPVCPSINIGRNMIAHYDMNLFYYYKSSVATYCDIEDSFWRLLMDGWYRGVVTGSDSWLLLLVTLPKAFIFKTTIVVILTPLLGAIYGLVGIVLEQLVYYGITEANVVKELWAKHVLETKKQVQDHHVSKSTEQAQAYLWKAWNWLTIGTHNWVQLKRRLYLANLSKLFDALYYAGLLRLVWRYFLETYLPPVAWLVGICTLQELALEIAVYYFLSFLCKRIDAQLDKIFPKPGAPGAAAPPLTLKSEAYDVTVGRGFPAQYAYFKARVDRLYSSYKGDAGAIGGTLETIFSTVVGLRLIGIVVMPYFNIAKVLRGLLMLMGFGGMLSRHSTWFSEVTGYSGDQGVYLSETLADFGLGAMFNGFTQSLHVTKQVAVGDSYEISEMVRHIYEFIWRAILPVCMYYAQKHWTALNAGKEAAFAARWKSKEGGAGTFKGWMSDHGCPEWTAGES